MTFSTEPQETTYPQTLPRAIFLDSGGVINDNDRRAPQWVRLLENYMPTTKIGGPGRLWGKSNAIMSNRLFKGENPLWNHLIDRAKDFHQFYREYHLFWVQEGVRLVNHFLKEEYDELLRNEGGDDNMERLSLVQLTLPESEEEQIQIAYDAHLYCTSIVRADYPGAVEAILQLKFDQGFTMYTSSGESAPELDLTLKTLGMSTLLEEEEKKAAHGRLSSTTTTTTTPQVTTDISVEEAEEVLRPVFTKLYGPDLIHCHKGSSEFYRRIFADSGVDARDALVVDDKEYILSWAKAHGARTVMISTKDRRGKEMMIEVNRIQADGTVAKVVVPVVDDQLESLSQLPALTASWKKHLGQ